MLRIRQVALVARDLEPVVDHLCAVLGVDVCFRDPGIATFGLENAMVAVGSQFIEIVSPRQAGTSAGRLLDRIGSDTGYMIILQTDDLASARARAENAEARVVWEISLKDVATAHLHPRDVGGAIVSLDETVEPDEWHWAGPDWKNLVRTDVVRGIRAAEIFTQAPRAMGRRWVEIFGREMRETQGASEWLLDGNSVRFLPEEGAERFGGIELDAPGAAGALQRARDRGLPVAGDCVTICGTRFLLKSFAATD